MKFKKITINNWKQFKNIDIDFHPNLTILTGANGSGKTTILNLLAKHFGWEIMELATPKQDVKTGFFSFVINLFKKQTDSAHHKIGEMVYNNNSICGLFLNEQNSAQYEIFFENTTHVRGVNIPSHRPIFFYEQVSNIPTRKITKELAYNQIRDSKYSKFTSNYGNLKAANFYIKETLLNWAIGGGGNKFMVADPELEKNFIQFEEILKKTLPESLGFIKISIRNFEIVFETKTGDFMLDAVSGGISAIIDLAWSIFTNVLNNEESVVLIDEVENHLHATLQRAILPSLIDAFPNVQFIVSTHSPLIIGSVKDSNVYAFRYNDQHKVYNEKLDLINKAKNANEILNEVLGVPFSMPIWVEHELETIIRKYSEQQITPDIFKNMRKELNEKGLENLMPWAMDKTLEKLDDKNK